MGTPLAEDIKALEHPGIYSFEQISIKEQPYEWGLGSTERVARLRDAIYSKAIVIEGWAEVLSGMGKTTFRKNVKLDVDKARIITNVHKETEGLPMVTRKALSMKRLCEEFPIYIEPGQLIVGDPNSAPDEIRWHPEMACEYMREAVAPDGGFYNMVTDEERKEIYEICDYWKNSCNESVINAVMPKDVIPYLCRSLQNPSFYANHWSSGPNVIGFDFEVLMSEGLNARVARVEKKLEELNENVINETGNIKVDEYIEKRRNWEAQIISAKALIRFAERYAELAEEQAKNENDQTRKNELLEMAHICRRVPGNPPDSFQGALQFQWFIEVIARFLTGGNNGSGARIDQVWYPYFKKDIQEGKITRDQAKELLECWMIRVQVVGAHAEHPQLFTVKSGGEVFYTANIGGTNMDGSDACNDLTALCLECLSTLRINQPAIMIRFHRNMSEDMITRITETVRAGTGHPSIFNEELLEKWALMRGYSPYDAKRTQAAGCVAMNCTGKFLSAATMAEIGILAQPKMLEYAMFQGDDASGSGNRVDGSNLSRPKTKDPRVMKSADELLEMHCEQLAFHLRIANMSHNIGHQVLMEISPEPLTSFLMDDTLEEGIDLHKAWAKFDTWPNLVSLGYVNVSDSLAAIQKLVFDEKKYTIDQLITALKNNWEGQEEMRQNFLHAPKYGNDDDYADEWAVKTRVRISEEASKIKDAWGRPWTFDGSSVIAYQAMAFGIGATPDGRHASSPLADGTRSPAAGSDITGPTAVLNSAAKGPFLQSELFNQRFMPQFLEGDNKAIFNQYLMEWYEKMTIPHIQFNIVDSDVLKDAQVKPEKHPDLQVRIAGYSAYFVDLAPETQDSIIARSEQEFA